MLQNHTRRDEDETLSGSGSASHAVCSMHTVGKREARDTAMADRGAGKVRGTVAPGGPDGGGSHGDDGALLRCGGETSGAGGGSEPAPVQGDQRVSEEDGSPRCPGAGAVSGERSVAGGKDETQTEPGTDASGRDAGPAGEAAIGVEGQDQQLAGDAGHRVETGSTVEQDRAGAGTGPPCQRNGATGTAGAGRADSL